MCAFNGLQLVRIGDTMRITTGTAVLTYRVDRTGLGSKSAPALPRWASDSTVPNRVVLVTCDRTYDDVSYNNFIVVARLVHHARRAPAPSRAVDAAARP